MTIKSDTIKVELISDEYKVLKKNDSVLVIEQKEKVKTKELYEHPIFVNLLVPILIIVVNILISKYILGRKGKAEVKKIEEDIKQIRSSFQPIVLSTIQSTQEYILKDKIDALKEIASLKSSINTVNQEYDNGEPLIDEQHMYYQYVYRNMRHSDIQRIDNIVSEKGYLFPDNVANKLKNLLADLGNIYDIQKRESSTKTEEIPNDALALIKTLTGKFDDVINDIRADLHLNSSYVHDFINKYNNLK